MHKDDLPVPEPCHADWDQMSGDERKRFCGSCQKHVHHLSEMTQDEALLLIAREDALCVRYDVEPSGRVRFQPETLSVAPSPLRRRRTFGAMMAGLALTLPAGCGTAEAGAAATEGEPSLLEEAAEALGDWLFGPDEGCELTEPQTLEEGPRVMGQMVEFGPERALDTGLSLEVEPETEPEPKTEAEPEPETEPQREELLRAKEVLDIRPTMGVLIMDDPTERSIQDLFAEDVDAELEALLEEVDAALPAEPAP